MYKLTTCVFRRNLTRSAQEIKVDVALLPLESAGPYPISAISITIPTESYNYNVLYLNDNKLT